MIPRVLPFVPHTSGDTDKVSTLLSFTNRSIYPLLTMPTPYEKEMERLRKLLAELETDEHSDFDNEDKGPEDVLEENFKDHGSLIDHDTESEKVGDSGNEEMINSELFLSKDGVQ
ncbi:hypothetical protein AVEN_99946-1 [Araneus ventricosus]|uniref:Uncharacterized protein n=1 Tax=Araneus ventricosus TaxID=182803 RepID=A0A4Y2H5H4_ARAVE|nr:hypothetical protein AVEN_99946-1 [Araneus ventricosus]